MSNQHSKQVALLTIATIFISTSGALGKYIALPPPVTIWWRSALGMLFLFVFCKFVKIPFKLKSKQHIWPFILSAIFMGAHWITYFYSLQMSNVAIGMLSLFTFPIMTALLEPLFFKHKLDPIHIALGFLVLIGIYFLAPEFSIKNEHFNGILLGIISALCYALRILILKKYTSTYDGTILMFYQILILSILLVPALVLMDSSGLKSQFPYILLLALLTTAVGHSLFIRSLKYFKVSTASIIGSAQPIFGIIIAFIFLSEIPRLNTIIGGSIILVSVVIESLRSRASTKG